MSNFLLKLKKIDYRTIKIIATAACNYAGKLGQGIVVLLTLPIAKEILDPELFGLWMMASALLGFMSFADFGIGNSILNSTTKAKSTNNQSLLLQTVTAGYFITSAIAIVLITLWAIWLGTSNNPTVIVGALSPHNKQEATRALTSFVIIMAVNIPASLIQRIQLGMQHGYLNGINQIAGSILTLFLAPFFLKSGGNLTSLILSTIGVQCITNIANTIFWAKCNKFSPLPNPSTGYKGKIIALLKSGSVFFLLQMAAAFAFQSDSIVITQTLGQRIYGDFAVVQKLFLIISMILNAAIIGMWPAFGDALETNNIAWAKTALKRGMFFAAIASILGTLILCISTPLIFRHWLKSTHYPSISLLLVLSTWTIIDAISNVCAAFMNGANILKPQLAIAISMALISFLTKWALTPLLGPGGAVLSTIISYCLISVPGQIIIFRKKFSDKEKNHE